MTTTSILVRQYENLIYDLEIGSVLDNSSIVHADSVINELSTIENYRDNNRTMVQKKEPNYNIPGKEVNNGDDEGFFQFETPDQRGLTVVQTPTRGQRKTYSKTMMGGAQD